MIEFLLGCDVVPRIGDFHTFGCPVFALDVRLQGQKSIPRWNTRTRLGINLGKFPNHSRNVFLVLSTSSGCMSPQFHVIHNDFFETVHGNSLIRGITIKWKLLVGFTHEGVVDEPTKHEVIVSKKKRIINQVSQENKRDSANINSSPMNFELNDALEGHDQPPGLEDHHLLEETIKNGEPTTVQMPLQRQPTTAGN